MADKIDPTNIPNLLKSSNSVDEKARLFINRLIVKPIPQRKDKPKISIKSNPLGNLHMFNLIDI